MEIKGSIKKIAPTQSVGSNGFQKRELIVTTEEQYPQHLKIEFVQDKCAILDQYNEGDAVSVSINLRGREWTNPQGEVVYFNSINGWRIEKMGGQTIQEDVLPPMDMEPLTTPAPKNENTAPNSSYEDDLPF